MISIKPAEVNDLPAIRQIAYETWPSAYGEILSARQLEYMLEKIYSLPSLQYEMDILKREFIMVFDDETPVGFAVFSVHADDSSTFHLNKIYVHPNQQGKNIGKQILDYVVDQIKSEGATLLQLNVNRYNKALHFYKKQGFDVIREEDIDIGEGYFMNDYVMELKW